MTRSQPLLIPVHPNVTLLSTVVLVGAAAFSAVFLPDSRLPFEIFRFCGVTMGLALVGAIVIEAGGKLRRVIRIDVAALLALYILTVGEFLVPNLRVLYVTSPEAAARACYAVLTAFAFLAIGRHFPLPRGRRLHVESLPTVGGQTVLALFAACTAVGFLYVFISVDFSIPRLIEGMTAGRWERPWLRGALGDWRSIFNELGALLYVVAASGGYILARPKEFGLVSRIVISLVLMFLFFFDFCEGTRTIFLIRICLFLAALMMAADRKNLQIAAVFSGLVMAALLPLSGVMLMARNVGLAAYLRGAVEGPSGNSFLIDNNMYSLARIMDVFPAVYKMPGFQVIWNSIIHPIPRALWPGKPEGWSITIEHALGATGYTIAVTYVGEAYLAGGFVAIIACSFVFGSLGATWNRVGLRAKTNMDLVLYASGFFAALVGMRSMQWITVAILPTIAVYVAGRIIARYGDTKARRRPVGRPLPLAESVAPSIASRDPQQP